MTNKSSKEPCEMPRINIGRYGQGVAGDKWAGFVEPEGKSWILFITKHGAPDFYPARDPVTGAVVTGFFICGVCKKPIDGMTTWTGMIPGEGPRHPACEGKQELETAAALLHRWHLGDAPNGDLCAFIERADAEIVRLRTGIAEMVKHHTLVASEAEIKASAPDDPDEDEHRARIGRSLVAARGKRDALFASKLLELLCPS